MGESAAQLRVQLVQLRPRKGRVEDNLARIREVIAGAAGETELVVLPETILSGYFVEGGVEEVARTPEEVAEGLGKPPAKAPDLVLGFYEASPAGVHNSVAWLTPEEGGWRVVHCHRKLFLPTYGVFDESRFVVPGESLRAFETRFGRVGILVCEEMLHSLVPTLLVLDGAELLVVVAASPARGFAHSPHGLTGNLERWEVAARATTQEHGVHLLICHLVGSEGGKIFPGGSTLHRPGGELSIRGPLFEEGVVSAVIDRSRVPRFRARSPLLSDLRERLPQLLAPSTAAPTSPAPAILRNDAADGSGPQITMRTPAAPLVLPSPEDRSPLDLDPALTERALIRFLRDEVLERRGFRRVVLGVSGGIDSAVALYLAVRALGSENVYPLFLPYSTSSPRSLADGRLVAEAAGVADQARVIEITGAVDSYIAGEEATPSPLRRGNLAARMRALILWDQGARLEALPLGTGNKSERLLGYFTWHADDSPPINPLGDLFKTQVWALARHLGVPTAVIEKAPSADLVEGVHDEDEIGVRYEVADLILHWLLSGYTAQELVRGGFEPLAVERVRSRLEGTHWKRELPTVATLSESAIGEFYLRPVDY